MFFEVEILLSIMIPIGI